MAKKFTTVTHDNVHLILFRINKFLQNNDAVSFYHDWGKFPKQMNKLGIKNYLNFKYVEKSNTGYSLKSKYKIRYEENYGIIINASADCFICIDLGSKVLIRSNQIIIKALIILKKHSDLIIKPFYDIAMAENYNQHEEQMSREYWADVEATQNEEMFNREFEKN